ncbi:MAG: hypothetical protein AAFO91_19310 [Bacteroidota bacterium]
MSAAINWQQLRDKLVLALINTALTAYTWHKNATPHDEIRLSVTVSYQGGGGVVIRNTTKTLALSSLGTDTTQRLYSGHVEGMLMNLINRAHSGGVNAVIVEIGISRSDGWIPERYGCSIVRLSEYVLDMPAE